jgi:hypothetical protein
MRMIDADALKDAIEDNFIGNTYDINKVVDAQPTIQPEIVRCKDCKYAEYIDDVQTLWCTECGTGRTVAPDDFCSYADMREVTE